jgi:pyrroloquinoline quinone biosynthesis protein E
MTQCSNPLALIAEITHRCPLHCVYCSNPLELTSRKEELGTADWLRVFNEAAALGVLHLHLTGGEPLARQDLTEMIAGARQARLYTNLITSGIGLSRERLGELVEAGLDHIQLSFQDSNEGPANWIAGTRAHAHKMELAAWIRERPIGRQEIGERRIAFTVNLVVHRQNIEHLEEMICRAGGTTSRSHGDRARAVLRLGRSRTGRRCFRRACNWIARWPWSRRRSERLRGKVRIDMVIPDYHARFPKACMGGWGRQLLLIDPAGRALPCHAAGRDSGDAVR